MPRSVRCVLKTSVIWAQVVPMSIEIYTSALMMGETVSPCLYQEGMSATS